MENQSVILDLLRRVAIRLRINHALGELAFGTCIALFALIAFRLLQPAFGASTVGWAESAALLALAGLGVVVLWRATRPATQMQAAGAADARADLKDELKSASWFIAHGEDSAFAQLQLARAARRARELVPQQLVPVKFPRSAGLALLLVAVFLVTDRSVSLASRDWASALPPEASSEAEAGSLRALLEDAPPDPLIERLDKALAVLERADVSPEAAQRAAVEAREAVDAADMRAVEAREALNRLAEAMKGNPRFEAVSRALAAGRTDEATALLEQIRQDMGIAPQPNDPSVPGDAAAEGVRAEQALSESVEDTARALGNLSASVNEESMNSVLKNIEDAQKLLDAQERVREVNRRMNDFLAASSQRNPLTASRFGNQANPSNATPSPQTGSTTMQGGTMFRQGAVARGDDDQASNEGNKAGSASGHSAAAPLEGISTERLAAKLQRENIRLREQVDRDDGEGEKSWFYSPTEAARADTALSGVRGRDDYAGADVMSPELIPMRQRGLVKEYFTNLHESEKR
jgi:hypothetical protein